MKLVIFDVDGTLVDSQNIIYEAQKLSFKALGLAPPTRAAALSIVGLSLREAFAKLVGPKGPLDELAQGYKDAAVQLRLSGAHEEILFPGAQETIARLAARDDVMLGLATGKSRRGVERMLDEQGWRDKIATSHTADEHPSKPAPDMILSAMAETGALAADTMMVGDTTYDIEMARAAGVRAIGVDWGYHRADELHAAGAEIVLSSFEALDALIGKGASR